MKKLSYYIITCLGLILIFGCSNPNEKANKLFVEASQLVKKAQEAEKTSYSDALKLYEKALEKIERIQSKYPSSELAVNLVQDRIKVGSYTIKEIKETIVPHIEIKAKAEENPLACALFVAKTIKDADDKSSALADIAAQYAKAGQYGEALQVAKTIKHAYYKSRALIDIAGEYAKARQRVDDKAKKILHEIVLTSSKPENPIVGKWREIGGTETIEFFKDGTVIVFSKGMTMGGSYKFVAKDRIKLELGGLGILAGPIVAKVSINGDELTFITSDGDVSKYKRLK